MIKLEFDGSEIDLKATKIIAVARNYKAHAEEMGSSIPEEPKIFLKPPSVMIGNNGVVILPKMSECVDYEVELAVIIKNSCRNISSRSISGYSSHLRLYLTTNR